jgi:hypothetical protein
MSLLEEESLISKSNLNSLIPKFVFTIEIWSGTLAQAATVPRLCGPGPVKVIGSLSFKLIASITTNEALIGLLQET